MQGISNKKISLRTKLGYGFGSAAYGIKDNGFAVFLLFYYNQVIGVSAPLVGAALFTALLADSFLDPIIGKLSDGTRTKLGRRHPWLYASSIPIALTWLLLWNPPAMGETATFFYILGTAIAVRFSISAYEVPSLAMLPELANDPHERTNIMRYRFLFGWASGLIIMALAFGYFMAATPDYPNGQLNPDGYSGFAVFGAIVMFVAVIISAKATHKIIIDKYHKDKDSLHKEVGFTEVIRSFTFRPFAYLLFASLFAYTNQGIIFALTMYLFNHIWELSQAAFVGYSLLLFAGVILAFLTVTPVSKRIGKTNGASLFILLSIIFGTLPYWLRLTGLFPDNSSDMLVPALFTLAIIGAGFGIAALILSMSMMADIADIYTEQTGKKSEGLFSAGMFFMQKLVGGVGLLLAGVIIAVAGIPDNAAPGSVAPDIVYNLTLYFAIATSILGLLTAWAFKIIPLSESQEENA